MGFIIGRQIFVFILLHSGEKLKMITVGAREKSVGVDPVPEVCDPGIDPRDVGGTAHAPGHQPHHRPPPRHCLADEWRPAVPGTRIFAHFAAGANLTRIQGKLVAHAALLEVDGRLELGVAPGAVHEGNVHLVLEELKGPVGRVFAPAGHPAARPATVVEPKVELVVAGRQAGRVDR